MNEQKWLFFILMVYLGVGSLYAALVPAWQSPDEPAHYNYVRQLANGFFPIMEPSDYNQDYISEVVSSKFDPQYDVSIITYEDWQPPLYYLLLTPVFVLTNGSLLALRLTSLLIGAGAVILAYAVGVQVYPMQRWVGLTTAVFVAFLPQNLSILASVNNDSLTELLIAATLLVLIQWVSSKNANWRLWDERKYLLILGFIIGLALLTKLSAYLLVPLAGVALLGRYWGRWDDIFPSSVLLFAPAFLMGSVWWGRNLIVYNGIDPFAMLAHDGAVVGQTRTAEWILQFGLNGTIQRFLQTTFNSFWGQFGWMAVPMPAWIYQPLLIFSAIVVLGLVLKSILGSILQVDQDRMVHASTLSPFLLVLMLMLTLGMHIYYNITFVQHQGRYLFPALIPIGIGIALGLGSWLTILKRFLPEDIGYIVSYLMPLFLGFSLVLLDLYALFFFIVPNL
jgi:4-amino-4-deoxy-L-arabinose transferase-like glycosyltransferase